MSAESPWTCSFSSLTRI